MDDEFERVRQESDPVLRGKRATALLAVYQQRSTELARIRRAAIEEARDVLGGSYTDVARAFGLTKGRITQIRNTAPPAHRAIYGIGPIVVALPGRTIFGREDLVIASEDDSTGNEFLIELEKLAFISERYVIDPREEWEPTGDAVVVCGPASAHIGLSLMSEDPVLTMAIGDGAKWYVVDKESDTRFLSPLDEVNPRRADHGYIARHKHGDRVITHIAGLHALGSIGAAHYLVEAAPDLFSQYGDVEFSLAVTTQFEGQTPVSSEVLVPPKVWE